MYKRVLFSLFIQLLLWQTCLSLYECNRTMNATVMTFNCPSHISSQELGLYDLTVAQLDSIQSLVAKGGAGTRVGPFTRIPANICLFRNLQSIDFSYNQIGDVDPTGSLSTCLSNVVTLDVSFNQIFKFPSVMIYNMSSLKNLYFQSNRLKNIPVTAFPNISSLEIINFSYNLLTTVEFWALEVKTTADFRYNQIGTITNQYIFDQISARIMSDGLYLDNNMPTINFTDAVYEMYNRCNEVYQWYFTDAPTMPPDFTWKMTSINFGSSKINCNCDQTYFLHVLSSTQYANARTLPIQTAMCSNYSLSINDLYFLNSSCATPVFPVNSTVNFTDVYPRLCKIVETDNGTLTSVPTAVPPSLNVSTYPYYTTAFMNPGACYFSFSNTTAMVMHCTNDTSNSLSTIPASLFSSSYMSAISYVTFLSPISSFPTYLCSLPSGKIDLRYQAFTTLTDATFPCLDSFKTVILASNEISSVNMSNGNFTKLNSLDLSSNQLTLLPYSILNPTPTSLRYLDLRNNSIAYVDLFLYTLKDISIDLDNNPINSSNIMNPQNVILNNTGDSTANITLPASAVNTTVIITDTLAVTYGLCNNFQSLRNTLLNLQTSFTTVQLKCTCESINLKEVYAQNGYNIISDFNCSNPNDQSNFYNLNMSSCQNATNFQTGLCAKTAQPSSALPQSTTSGTILLSTTSGAPIGLIVGLTVGLVCLLILIGILAAIYLYKRKTSPSQSRKLVGRAAMVGQKPNESLGSHLKQRNTRSLKLPPINDSQLRKLPALPVVTALPSSNSTKFAYQNTNVRSSSRGIPLEPDTARSPSNINLHNPLNSNDSNTASKFHSSNNAPLHQSHNSAQHPQLPELQRPPVNPLLNAGGDPRYQ